MSQTYANQTITDVSSGGVLTFSNIGVTEVDTLGAGGRIPAGSVLPINNFNTNITDPYSGLEWSAFFALVKGGIASVTLTFSYNVTVDATSGATITGLEQAFTGDYLSGNGISATSVETVADSNGNLVGTLAVAGPSGTLALSTGYTYLHVVDVLTVSVSDPGSLFSGIGVSEIDQGFSLTAGIVPINGGGGNDTGSTPGTIIGSAFIDGNGDGTQGAGELGIPNVAVKLLDTNGATVQTAYTDSSGVYTFASVTPGNYTVVFTTPSGDVPTTPIADAVTVVASGTTTENAGFAAPASITGTTFTDNNANGTLDTGDVNLGGVTVTLEDSSGNTLGTTTTNATGGYSFTNLLPGSYSVVFTTPGGDVVTTPISDSVTLASGGTAVENAGFYVPATITGTTFIDNNTNATLDSSDTKLGGVVVTLDNASGVAVDATTTDATGGYSFTDLAPGSYSVVFTTPGSDVATTSVSDAVALPSGGSVVENAGFYVPATITGTTFIDNNTNATLDSGEATLAGVAVTLKNAAGTAVGTASTDASGNYSFTALAPGSYSVVFTTPGADVATTPLTDAVTLPSGGSAVENAGFYAPASITGTTFNDNNINATLDSGDTTLAGVVVTLDNASGAVVGTTTTNATGGYSFTGLAPGSYSVVFTTPGSDVATTPVSDAVTLSSGGTAVENAGFYAPASITGTTFTDNNANGTLGAGDVTLAGVTVTLEDASGNTVGTIATDATGGYSFTGLTPGSYSVVFTTPGGDVATTSLTDALTLVSGGTAVENAGFYAPATITGTTFIDNNTNATLDSGEATLAGVAVTLKNAAGAAVGTASTDASGNYSFTGLAPGSYSVVFTTPGTDVATTPVSDAVTLSSGGAAVENAGFYVPATITGTTFIDNNTNAALDSGEATLAGVVVTLKNAAGTAVGTATTNPTGGYSFTGLAPGSYSVVFTTPGADVATTPLTDAVTLASGGSAVENAGFYAPATITGTTFLDANKNATLDSGEAKVAGVVVTLDNASGAVVGTATTNTTGGYSFTGLAPGSYSVVFATPGGDSATTPLTDAVTLASGGTSVQNAGFYAPPVATATITGTTFIDNNTSATLDTGDTTLAGVTVALKSGTTTLATTTTNTTGGYSFTGLAAGSYSVVFTTPTGDTASTATTDAVTLLAGGTAVENAGFYKPASITGTTFIDCNASGTFNCGEATLGCVTVTLKDASGALVATTTTNSSGVYSFTGEKPGTYTVVFTTPSGDVASTPVSDTVTLLSGGTAVENAGFYVPATITGTTFLDNNTNGSLDCGDSNLAGVLVTLTNAAGAVVGSTTTNANGGYSFTGEKPGTYTVAFTTPSGDTATTSVSDTVTLCSGGTAVENAGFYKLASISGTTFIDTNTNGVLDSGDTTLAGVTVTLKSGTTTVATTTTNATGGYSFTGEKPGTYTVVFTTPAGDTASTATTDTLTLVAGGSAVANAGFYAAGTVSGVAFNDKNANGTQDSGDSGVSCVTVTLKNASGAVVGTTTTNTSGGYSFTGEKPGTYTVVFGTPSGDVATTPVSDTFTLLAGGSVVENAGFYAACATNGTGSISGEVWNDVNANGTLACGESGLSGVTVDLLNGSGTTVLATMTTNSSGGYSFGKLALGSYEIKVIAPTGDVFSPKVSGSCSTTSDVNPANGVSSVITLSGCGTATVDAGVHPIISFSCSSSSGGGCGGGYGCGSGYQNGYGCGGGSGYGGSGYGYGCGGGSGYNTGGGTSGGSGCGVSSGCNTICGWDDGTADCGGYNSGYGCTWTYSSGCNDYHNESSGSCSTQSASTAPINPFSCVTISDTANVAITITLTGLNGVKTDADGTLSGKGLTKTGVGTYTLASTSAATMTTEMQALVFTPTANQVAAGQSVTTGFGIAAIDANGFTDTDTTTTVVVTATDHTPTLTQSTLSLTVAEGGTLQGLWSQILANAHDVDLGDQAKLTISAIGQSNTAGFLNYNAASGLLTYTADGYQNKATTDSFTYTIADPTGLTVTGTVNIAVTGATKSTSLGTSGNDTMTLSSSNARIDSLGGNDKLTISGSSDAVFAGSGTDTITVSGKSNMIYTGAGSDTVNLSNTGNTIVLSLGGSDTINGATLSNSTKLNLDTLLAQSGIQGATLADMSKYFSVSTGCGSSNVSLLFNGAGVGCGSGSTVAVLNGLGSNVTLASMISHNMLQV